MNKYTFVFLGDSRTGTTSMWVGFRQHTQISTSKRKERLLQIPSDVPNLNFYIDYNFYINDKTKILFEGSPAIIKMKSNFVHLIKDCRKIKRVVQIYTLRNAKERILSYFNNLLFAHYRRGMNKPWWINEDDELIIDNFKHELYNSINSFEYLKKMEEVIGIENMFIVRLDKINSYMKQIQNFLKIDYKDFKIGRYNTTLEKSPTIDCVRLSHDFRRIIESDSKKIDLEIEKNKKRIYKRYKVHE